MRASLMRHAAKLMEAPEGLNALLPSLYSAMCGTLISVRAAAAKVIGKIGRRRLDDLPELMLEAFVALLRDPYVGVHQAAIESLSRISLPAELDKRAAAAVDLWIQIYASVVRRI
jgi:HEAT repeat protein